MAKLKYIIAVLILYLTGISAFISLMLIFNLNEILDKGNILLLIILCINLFLILNNVLYVIIRKINYSWILLYNAIFSFVFSFFIRLNGLFINDIIGANFSIYVAKNRVGFGVGFKRYLFNVTLKFFTYDTIKYPGFDFELNLLMVAIGIVILVYRKSYIKLYKG